MKWKNGNFSNAINNYQHTQTISRRTMGTLQYQMSQHEFWVWSLNSDIWYFHSNISMVDITFFCQHYMQLELVKIGEHPEGHQAPCRKYKYWVLLLSSLFIILCCCQGSVTPQISDKQRKLFLAQPPGCGWRTVQHWSPRSSPCLTNVHQVPCISQLKVGTSWSQSSNLCCISLWRQAHKGSQKETIPLWNISCLNSFFQFSVQWEFKISPSCPEIHFQLIC